MCPDPFSELYSSNIPIWALQVAWRRVRSVDEDYIRGFARPRVTHSWRVSVDLAGRVNHMNGTWTRMDPFNSGARLLPPLVDFINLPAHCLSQSASSISAASPLKFDILHY